MNVRPLSRVRKRHKIPIMLAFPSSFCCFHDGSRSENEMRMKTVRFHRDDFHENLRCDAMLRFNGADRVTTSWLAFDFTELLLRDLFLQNLKYLLNMEASAGLIISPAITME